MSEAIAFPTAEFPTAQVQAKPWGSECIFADGEHGYVGKVITVRGGEALSLQLHEAKDETLHIISGVARLAHGPDARHLAQRDLRPGDTVHLAPRTLHRLTALTDVVFVEASTAGPGWREDVVRLEDSYGRTGTTAP